MYIKKKMILNKDILKKYLYLIIYIMFRIGNRISHIFSKPSLIVPRKYYHENVIDHFENPRNVGSLDKKCKSVGTGLVGAPACGDVIKLQIKVEDGVIVESKFKTFGCGSAIAASSYGTEWIKNKKILDAEKIKNIDIASCFKFVFTTCKITLFNVNGRCG